MKRPWPILPVVYVALLMVPVYWLVTMALKNNSEIAGQFTLYPHAPTLKHFALIFTESAWSMGYVHALVYVSLNVLISVGVAIPAAYGFSRHDFPGKRPLFFSFLLFRMMAPVILLVPFVQIFSDIGLFDTHVGVALAHCFFNVPIAVWILEGFMSAVPREMDESARVDGHSLGSYFFRILMPQIAPGIAVTAFFCFMFSWVEFLLANALTAVAAKPIAGIMTRAGNVLVGNFGQLAAASVVGFIPGLICIWLVRRHLVRGFSMGRVS
jgi:glycerol transport system permease protein